MSKDLQISERSANLVTETFAEPAAEIGKSCQIEFWQLQYVDHPATCGPICQRREGLRNSNEKLAPRAEVMNNNEWRFRH